MGDALLKILEQRAFPVNQLYLLASEQSVGEQKRFNGRSCRVQAAASFDFKQVDLVLMSVNEPVARVLVPRAIEAGAVVIDNSAAFRQASDVPLVIPEVNGDLVTQGSYLFSNPNCAVIQMLVALKPIYDLFGIRRINIATYQSVSGAGQKAINELASQTGTLLNGKPVTLNYFSKQIAFNLLPQIDLIEANGYSREEMKLHEETQKILQDEMIQVNATTVRVPLFYGHSEAIHLETNEPYELDAIQSALHAAPGVKLYDATIWPTPFELGQECDLVFVGRLRRDLSHPNGLNLWVVADNIRKGAALNAVQIAEAVLNQTV